MRIRALVTGGLLAACGTALLAQEPVVGVDDPESLFTGGNRTERRNKEAALHIMRELLQCNQWSRAGEWLTEQYIQHNPNAESGREGVVYYFTQVLNRQPTPTCGELTTPVVAVVAEGDLVTVIMPRQYDDPRNPGETYYTTWFDTWRFVDGKADEHWDPATIAEP
jgi:predicted SnoaL-like aldol condensation-catalyzing enzyme